MSAAETEPDPESRCTATARSTGKQCGRKAMAGATVCDMHGGKAPQVRRAAETRAARVDAEAQAQRMVARAGVDADPIEHLLESLHRAAALVEVWGEMVSKIDQEAEEDAAEAGGIRGELGYEEDTDEDSPYELRVRSRDRLLALDRHGQATVHPYMREYEAALERRAKFAKLCADAGVAERRVEIAEQQGQMMARAVVAILDELGVDRTPEVNRTVGRHLRLLSGGEAAA